MTNQAIDRAGDAGLATVVRAALGSGWHYCELAAAGALHLRRERLGRRYRIDQGGSYAVFRETVSTDATVGEPVVLIVGFRLRFIGSSAPMHWLFQRLCILTTPFWSGFHGFRVKLWMVEPQRKNYLGIYAWNGHENAARYARLLVRVLQPLSTPGSVWYEIRDWETLPRYLAAHSVETGTAELCAETETVGRTDDTNAAAVSRRSVADLHHVQRREQAVGDEMDGRKVLVTGELIIQRAIADVFDCVADERNEPEYNPRLRRVTLLTGEPIGVGTRFRAETRMIGRTIPMLIELTEYDRPRRLASTTRMATMDIRGELTFEQIPEGTRMRWSWELAPHSMLRLLTPLVTRIGQRQEMTIWTGLKRFLEEQSR